MMLQLRSKGPRSARFLFIMRERDILSMTIKSTWEIKDMALSS